MSPAVVESLSKPSAKALLAPFGAVEDPREPWRVAHRPGKVLLLVAVPTICDCGSYDAIATSSAAAPAMVARAAA